jgi:hypothetical protein
MVVGGGSGSWRTHESSIDDHRFVVAASCAVGLNSVGLSEMAVRSSPPGERTNERGARVSERVRALGERAQVGRVQSIPPAISESGPRSLLIYHGGSPPRFAQLLSTTYTRPINAAWMPAACWTGRIVVGKANRLGQTPGERTKKRRARVSERVRA